MNSGLLAGTHKNILQGTENPTTTINPLAPLEKYLNISTLEFFTCIDNTTDSNIWVGSAGTVINRTPTSGLFFQQGPLSGTVLADTSGNGNNITVNGAVNTKYKALNCIYLMGSSNSTGMGSRTFTDFSVSVWLKPRDIQTLYRWFVIGTWNNSGSSILYTNAGIAYAGVALPSDTQITCGMDPTFGFTHIVYVRNGTVMKLYINGTLSASTTISSGQVSGVTRIGDTYSPPYGHMAGLRIYNRAIDDSEVFSLFLEGR